MASITTEELMALFPWLTNLGAGIFNFLEQQVIEDNPPQIIAASVRQLPQYKTRFAGMQTRLNAGLSAINESEYLALEDAYRSQLREFGVLGIFGPTEESFRSLASNWIGSNVSVAELNRRLDAGVSLTRDLAPTAQAAFRDFYGIEISPDALLAYTLDPKMGTDIIEDQIATAIVGGEALRFGLNISRTRADILRQSGVSAEMARTGFSDVAREQGILTSLANIYQYTPFSQNELEDFFFHEDPSVGQRRSQIFQRALGDFQGRTSARTQQGGMLEVFDRQRTV